LERIEDMDNIELIDTVSKAMRTAWQLGQTYWRQADSDFTSDHRRSDETQRKYDMLVQETIAAISRSQDAPRCQCCGYLVTESEHRGCLRAAERSQDVARVALNDEQRRDIQECIDYLTPAAKDFSDLGMVGMGDSKHARCIRVLRSLLAPQPPQAGASDELASMTRMFHAACADLGAINEALGLDPDDGGAEPIIAAIEELRAERDKWVDANYAAPAAPAPTPQQISDYLRGLDRIERALVEREAREIAAPAPAEPKGEQSILFQDWYEGLSPQWRRVIEAITPAQVEQRAGTLSEEQQPSLASPLTPYGLLMRALRIVAGTTLYDMAKELLTTPAKLSAMEFGREPVTQEFAFDVSAYFDAHGVPYTLYALNASLLAAHNGGKNE
jgi:hypothetical protein